jgi:hypothetical protein
MDTLLSSSVRFQCQNNVAMAIGVEGCPSLVLPPSVVVSRGLAFPITAIASHAFYECSFLSIIIPRSIEAFDSDCLSSCRLLSSVSFESNSQLKRIASRALSWSSLRSIVLPRSITFLDSSAFVGLNSNLSISTEPGRIFQPTVLSFSVSRRQRWFDIWDQLHRLSFHAMLKSSARHVSLIVLRFSRFHLNQIHN